MRFKSKMAKLLTFSFVISLSLSFGCLSYVFTIFIKFDDPHGAVMFGDIRSLEYMAHLNPGLMVQPDDNGWQPIHLATYVGYLDVVQLLLEKGATLKDKTISGHDVLDLAWQSPYVTDDHELMKFLRKRKHTFRDL